jgi:hypothetical protein
MKKSLLLALALVAACGYVMAEGEETTTPAPKDEATQTVPTQEDELDMDAELGDEPEAEEAK